MTGAISGAVGSCGHVVQVIPVRANLGIELMGAIKCIFLGGEVDGLPELGKCLNYFKGFHPEDWIESSEGVFSYEDQGCLVAALFVLHNGRGGISVRYDYSTARDAREVHYSVASPGAMNLIIDVGDDRFAPAGSFLPPMIAWNAVEDFFVNPLEKSSRISWMNTRDISWPEY